MEMSDRSLLSETTSPVKVDNLQVWLGDLSKF